VSNVGCNAPAIKGKCLVLFVGDFQKYVSLCKKAGLLVRAAVVGQDTVLIKYKFGHQRPAAVTKRLLPNALNRLLVAVFTVFAEQLPLP
jgi:hypothetical protein